MKELFETVWNAPAEDIANTLGPIAWGLIIAVIISCVIVGIITWLVFRGDSYEV
jgi:NhaP-type Na+/H+ or K+/H+ antiporter